MFCFNPLKWLISHKVQNSLARHCTQSTNLKKILAAKISSERKRISYLRKNFGLVKIAEVNVNSLFNGLKDLRILMWEPSVVDEYEEIRFRDLSISECRKNLPRAICSSTCQEPLPESLFWLLLTGKIPNHNQVLALSQDWSSRACVPDYIIKMIQMFPKTLHPITQFSAAVMAMNGDSAFTRAYANETPKSHLWESAFEDAMDLIAKLPKIASTIYRNIHDDARKPWQPNTCIDYSSNFALNLGFLNFNFVELLRLYLFVNSDHGGEDVSSHAAHFVGLAMTNPYLAFATGLNGLARHEHGFSSQEALLWLQTLEKGLKSFGPQGDAVIESFVSKTLEKRGTIPGFESAVRKKLDLRYSCLMEFGERHMSEDRMFQIAVRAGKIVPQVLKKLGKAENCWPDINLISGVLLHHYGLKEIQFYPVLFGVSKALGLMANLIWSEALGLPIAKIKSISLNRLEENLKKNRMGKTVPISPVDAV